MENTIAKWVRAAFVPAIGLSLALSVNAQQTQTQSPHGSTITQQEKQQYRGMRASQLIGKSVRNPQGENLGHIDDLIVDMNQGKVRYAMLRFDPGIFSGERLFAVPTTELTLSRDKDDLVYRMSRERLEKTGIGTREWPSALKNREYLAGLDRAYGVVQPSDDRRAFSASELLGKDVNGAQGNEIGEIRELVIDMNSQRVHYAVLAFDPSWTAPEKLFAFPLSAFTFTQGKDELALDVDKSRLQKMRSFDHNLWTAFATPVVVADIDRYLVTFERASGKSSTTGGEAGRASGQSRTTGVVDADPPNYSASMQRLQNAAQKLRESIQAMAQQPPGESRAIAVRNAQQALFDTNQAMVQLPPQLRTRAAQASGKSSSSGGAGELRSGGSADNGYGPSVKRLQAAEAQLRGAIQAMAQQQPGERRDRAIDEAHQALLDANAAMMHAAAMSKSQH